MSKTAWCLTHNSYVKVENLMGDFHFLSGRIWPDEPEELIFCEGPFTSCEPPACLTDDEWEEVFGNMPDPDELERINEENEHLVEY